MAAKAIPARRAEAVTQFSIFTANRLGRLHDLVKLFDSNGVHILGLTVVESTESAIIRCAVDDPDRARDLLNEKGFAFTEAKLLVVAVDSATELHGVMSALLEAELNINYLYSFIPHPHGQSMLALSMEDNEIGEKVLTQHQFKVLKQTDISR